MLHTRHVLARLKYRRLSTCTGNKNNNNKNEIGGNNGSDDNKRPQTYRQLDKLDFMTAAKILFTENPKQKKFGLGFHLAQLFFVCLPSFAVYLVAMYARHEMDRVEMEFQQKKKKEEGIKAKEEEQKAVEIEAKSNAALSEVKERLDKLEVAVNEIVVDKKKGSDSRTRHGSSNEEEAKHLSPNDTGRVNSSRSESRS